MNMKMKKAIASGMIGLIALGGVAAAAPAAFAQDATDTTEQTTREERRAARHAERLQSLADEFGMTVEELQAARDAGQSLLEIAEAQGVDLDALRAERQAERQAEREARQAEREAARAESQANLAGLLGVSVDELQASREAGDSVADIANAQGVDVSTVISSLVADAEARIQERAAERDIDADRLAEKLDSLEERITARVNGEAPERGDGEGRLGRGGPRGAN